MATRKRKSGSKVVAKSPPNVALTLTIPVLKPRNRLAMNPLLMKSTAHTDAQSRGKRERDGVLETQRAMQEALNRRHGGGYQGGNDSGSDSFEAE